MAEKIVTTHRASDKEELGYARDVARAYQAWLESADILDGDSNFLRYEWMKAWLEDRAREAEEEIMKNVDRLACRLPTTDELNTLLSIADAASLKTKIERIFSTTKLRRSQPTLKQEVFRLLKD